MFAECVLALFLRYESILTSLHHCDCILLDVELIYVGSLERWMSL